MGLARSSEIRRRKLVAYRQALGDVPWLDVPDGLVPDALYAELLDRIARRTPPDFAFKWGLTRRLVELGILGHVVMSCATLGEVLDVWLSHAGSAGELVGIDARIDSDAEGSWVTILKPDRILSEAAARFCIEENAATFFAFCRDVVRHDFSEFTAEIAHDPLTGFMIPPEFPATLRFGCKVSRIIGPSSALKLPTVGRDGETFALLLRQLANEGLSMESPAHGPTAQTLFNHFLQGNSRIPSQAEAAKWLGVSTRTLVHRLGQEGTSYSRVLDEYRRIYATALMSDSGLCAKQIAHAVGFRHVNSLRRAYRGWTGMSILQSRRRLEPADAELSGD